MAFAIFFTRTDGKYWREQRVNPFGKEEVPMSRGGSQTYAASPPSDEMFSPETTGIADIYVLSHAYTAQTITRRRKMTTPVLPPVLSLFIAAD